MYRILSILGLIIAFLALILSFTPIGEPALLIAATGLIIGLIGWFKGKDKMAKFTIITSLVSVIVIAGQTLFIDNTIEKVETNQKIEKEKEEKVIKDLEELDELEGLE